MTEYIGTVQLIVNGKEVKDIKGITADPKIYRKVVKSMGGHGYATVSPDLNFTLQYILPKNPDLRFDFKSITNGTVKVLDDEGNTLEIYTGVTTLEVGSVSYTLDSETVVDIKMAATKHTEG